MCYSVYIIDGVQCLHTHMLTMSSMSYELNIKKNKKSKNTRNKLVVFQSTQAVDFCLWVTWIFYLIYWEILEIVCLQFS